MNFEWDPDKDAWNYVKHGIRFETAAMVFDDPYHVSQLDRVVDGEERWQHDRARELDGHRGAPRRARRV